MKGTEKQIKWAEDIKKEMFLEITACIEDLEGTNKEIDRNFEGNYKKRLEKRIEKYKRVYKELQEIESAKFFIESDTLRYINPHVEIIEITEERLIRKVG